MRAIPHPWSPLTEAEWRALAPHVTPATGRPAADRRALWDAVFWVACSRGPWRALPAALGRADSVHRMLRRAAASGLLQGLLRAAAAGALPGLEWRIARAWRRAHRLMTLTQMAEARRLGATAALPAEPRHLPERGLSDLIVSLAKSLNVPALLASPAILRTLRRLHGLAGGNRRHWRTTG